MAYSIQPREAAGVFAGTGAEREALAASLFAVHPPVAAAAAAAGPAVAGALVDFGRDQATALAEILDRIDTALAEGALAVAAYVRGDEEMAAQYGRASVVFAGVAPLPPPAGGPPPPPLVTGG
jgi:hypothetical protein